MGKNLTKRATRKKVAKSKCVCCKEFKATLQINENEWICNDCAQYANDLSPVK